MRNSSPPSITAMSSWGEVAAYMLAAERTGSWRDTARTYTEWMQELCKQRGCSLASLWRFKTAGKLYNEQRQRMAQRGFPLPELSDIPKGVSAESLELLTKMVRVVPADVLDEVIEKAMQGTITKTKVQEIWNAYAPLLNGKTARGRGVEVPQITLDMASRAEADVVLGLRRSKGAWLEPTPEVFEVYVGADVGKNIMRRTRYVCDALILSQADKHSPVVVHGLEIRVFGPHVTIKPHTVTWLSETCDYGWVASPAQISDDDFERIPRQLGVLEVPATGAVKKLRDAECFVPAQQTPKELMAMDLLARSMRWWKN